MLKLVVENPTKFCGRKDSTKALIYGIDDETKVRYNVASINAPENTEGTASILIDDYDSTHDYEEDYKVLNVQTKLP